MDQEIGIRGREKEIRQIHDFISKKAESRESGILYLTGPPGTGKTMSISYVIENLKKISYVNINCLKAMNTKSILSSICCSVGLEHFCKKSNESQMIDRLTKKFTSRASDTHLIVLDEMDQLPKSKNIDLVKSICKWPKLEHSKLILVCIANNVTLTSDYEFISSVVGKDQHVRKIVFKAYTKTDIESIINWYMENDENFEDASLEPQALQMISVKFAKDGGDIRGALNAVRSIIDDNAKHRCQETQAEPYPTPPSTPPSTPCKERTNMRAVATSIKKRQKKTLYKDENMHFPHQVVLTCIYKICSKAKNFTANLKLCKKEAMAVLAKHHMNISDTEYQALIEHLEAQGLVVTRKSQLAVKVIFLATEDQLRALVDRNEIVMSLIKS